VCAGEPSRDEDDEEVASSPERFSRDSEFNGAGISRYFTRCPVRFLTLIRVLDLNGLNECGEGGGEDFIGRRDWDGGESGGKLLLRFLRCGRLCRKPSEFSASDPDESALIPFAKPDTLRLRSPPLCCVCLSRCSRCSRCFSWPGALAVRVMAEGVAALLYGGGWDKTVNRSVKKATAQSSGRKNHAHPRLHSRSLLFVLVACHEVCARPPFQQHL